MSPARGDRKPCTGQECTGTMQFGRQGRSRAAVAQDDTRRPAPVEADARGWVCDRNAEHFREDG